MKKANRFGSHRASPKRSPKRSSNWVNSTWCSMVFHILQTGSLYQKVWSSKIQFQFKLWSISDHPTSRSASPTSSAWAAFKALWSSIWRHSTIRKMRISDTWKKCQPKNHPFKNDILEYTWYSGKIELNHFTLKPKLNSMSSESGERLVDALVKCW